MISYCKSCLHSALVFLCSDDRPHPPHRRCDVFRHPYRRGLHLLADYFPKQPHVVQSTAVRPASVRVKQGDPGAWGLHEAAPCRGIGSCTEGLGSESCDSGIEIDAGDETEVKIGRRATRWPSRKSAEMRFPPPLPWMLDSGRRRSRFLKADRRDGRVVLTEIQIDPPPEMLRAIRTEGRLRLELIGSERQDSPEENDLQTITEEESPEALDHESEISLEEEPAENEEWWTPTMRVEGQRCLDTVGGDGSSPLWWSQRFVTMA
ncbi:hypothetical protein KSP40_PGU001079 [Platanthera guangdongensis]|uniref:FAF domain-containing protein n=1 Tax=Platanthera guangdongensis TaxID=2320717 RepID=A0ABR2MB61_9ASPA